MCKGEIATLLRRGNKHGKTAEILAVNVSGFPSASVCRQERAEQRG